MTVASFATTTHSRPSTRPMPVTMLALGTAKSSPSSPYIPYAASGLSSRNGLPGSSSVSIRSRASILPRSVCLVRADSDPPCQARAVRSRSSSTSAAISEVMRPMLAIVNLRDYPVRVSERREQILAIAAELFAQKGFHGVSISELGAACGFSGPAIYRHFRSKDAVLAEMLVSISDELLTEGRRRVRAAGSPEEALRALVDWHVTFALEHQALIVVQDRDWAALPLEAREKVRETQRKYVEVWVKQLRAIHPDLAPKPARASVHATFGLLNSTPHSAFLPPAEMRALLAEMAAKALGLA